MKNLPILSSLEIINALERVGFMVRRKLLENPYKGGGQAMLWHSGKSIGLTVPKLGDEVKRGLLKLILNQAGLTEEEFEKLRKQGKRLN